MIHKNSTINLRNSFTYELAFLVWKILKKKSREASKKYFIEKGILSFKPLTKSSFKKLVKLFFGESVNILNIYRKVKKTRRFKLMNLNWLIVENCVYHVMQTIFFDYQELENSSVNEYLRKLEC